MPERSAYSRPICLGALHASSGPEKQRLKVVAVLGTVSGAYIHGRLPLAGRRPAQEGPEQGGQPAGAQLQLLRL